MRLSPRIAGLGLTVALFAAVFLGLSHAQNIEDWIKLRNYQPPPQVAALAADTTMTLFSKHIFYVNHPRLDSDINEFRKQCVRSEQSIVLGCYKSGEQGIEVYNVHDVRLEGVQQVTAAHEMLHAAYERLSDEQRQKVDAMLVDFYEHGLSDKRIQDTIASYKKTEPNDLVNEMHSVFGTEVTSLPAPLEDYYKKYFFNRAQVTAFAGKYEAEFTSRTAAIDQYDAQLAVMKQKIVSEEQSLGAQLASLQSDRPRIENSSDPAEINAYNARVSAYNAGVRQLQADIARYNILVEQRNAIASELKSLQSSIDTRLQTQPSQ